MRSSRSVPGTRRARRTHAFAAGVAAVLVTAVGVPDLQAGDSVEPRRSSSFSVAEPGPLLTPASTGDASSLPGQGTVDDPIELTWRALAALDYQTGEMSDQLQDAVGKTVRIPGFTVPLEDFASSATEFLLVPYVGACVHTPPPPPNQLVYVQMDEGKRAKMDGWNPVWLEGVLHVEDVSSVYGTSGYRVVGTAVVPYE